MRSSNGRASRIWYVLLLVPFVALLWLPFYARTSPEFFGVPFFYWYQFAWVPVTALLTWVVYVLTRAHPDEGGEAGGRYGDREVKP